jgi:hypothetical protein
MHATFVRSRFAIPFLLVALILGGAVVASIARAHSPAQVALTISFEDEYYNVTTSNPERTVFYEENVIVSNPAAEVACDPPSGELFPRGATLVTCTATLGDQTAEGSFYVLVTSSSGTETDIEVYTIGQNPEEIFQAASFTYNVEVRNNGSIRADRVIVSGSLPPQVELISAGNRCDTTNLPTITCTLLEVRPAMPQALPIDVKVKPGVTGAIFFTMTATIAEGPDDVFAANNSFTRRTDVRVIGFGDNTLYLPLLRR